MSGFDIAKTRLLDEIYQLTEANFDERTLKLLTDAIFDLRFEHNAPSNRPLHDMLRYILTCKPDKLAALRSTVLQLPREKSPSPSVAGRQPSRERQQSPVQVSPLGYNERKETTSVPPPARLRSRSPQARKQPVVSSLSSLTSRSRSPQARKQPVSSSSSSSTVDQVLKQLAKGSGRVKCVGDPVTVAIRLSSYIMKHGLTMHTVDEKYDYVLAAVDVDNMNLFDIADVNMDELEKALTVVMDPTMNMGEGFNKNVLTFKFRTQKNFFGRLRSEHAYECGQYPVSRTRIIAFDADGRRREYQKLQLSFTIDMQF